MKPLNPPVAIRMEFVGFDVPTRPRTKPPPRGSSGTTRAARSLLRRQLAGAKRIEAVLKPEAAAALADLRQRTGRTYSAIIEEALVAASKR
jgi:hypothetical protein